MVRIVNGEILPDNVAAPTPRTSTGGNNSNIRNLHSNPQPNNINTQTAQQSPQNQNVNQGGDMMDWLEQSRLFNGLLITIILFTNRTIYDSKQIHCNRCISSILFFWPLRFPRCSRYYILGKCSSCRTGIFTHNDLSHPSHDLTPQLNKTVALLPSSPLSLPLLKIQIMYYLFLIRSNK